MLCFFAKHVTLYIAMLNYNIKQYLPIFNHKNDIHHKLHINASHMTLLVS